MKELLKNLPKVDQLLKELPLAPLSSEVRKTLIQETLQEVRGQILRQQWPPKEDVASTVRQKVLEKAKHLRAPSLRKAINATGVLLHTGLGRAPLAERVQRALRERCRYVTLEVDIPTGERGEREHHIRTLLRLITGVPSATVVNNNAGATLIALAALAAGREVIVSRGQLVEIGGSFRIPDVMEQSGALLREVGCTNKTHPRDYEEAIGENTALLLEVHTSNYRIVGFHQSVSTEQLVEIGQRHSLPVMYDMGSGNFVDLRPLGILDEPTVQEKWRCGVDLITFSGDKLLGGPQCGILVGREKWIGKIRSHPLFRALRPDKLALVALEETLQIYLEDRAWEEIPCLRMLTLSEEELRERGEKVLDLARQNLPDHIQSALVATTAQMGSGALPTWEIPDYALSLESRRWSAAQLARRLRTGEPSVFPQVTQDKVLLHLRTVLPEEEPSLWQALRRL